MVWKCCVPGCTTSSKLPAHTLPKNVDRAHTWLRTIQRIDLIDAPKEVLSKLRICFDHFSDDSIISYGIKRRLKDNAIPTLNLPLEVDNLINNVIDNNNVIDKLAQIPENDQTNPNVMVITEHEEYSCIQTIQEERPTEFNENDQEKKIINIKTIHTPNVRRIQEKIRRYQQLLQKKKRIIQNLKKKKHENEWEKMMRNTSEMQNIFMDIIRKNYNSLPQGHRYDTKQKTLALMLYKMMGKQAYKSLRNVFRDIPSIQTLHSVLKKLPISARLNTLILRHLENIAPKMSEKDKVSILMWDEVSIQPKITYNIRKDIICGFEDWGNYRTNKVADHALVFMLRGLNSGWKLPISYSFCDKQTNTAQLMRCIKEHICKISNTGFNIVATVCDQGSSNVAAIKQLLQQTEKKRNLENKPQRQIIEIENFEIVPLYDPPHLIKGIRNNLLTKNLAITCHNNIPAKIASWDVIKTAWLIDKKLNMIRPQLKKLTKDHILEQKIKKMRVKYATQVLSGTVASCIETLTRSNCSISVNEEILSIDTEEGLATAEVVNFCNNLFDSVNGKDNENELRCPVTADSAHHAFWSDAKNIIRNMRYVDTVTQKIITSVPTLKNWMLTITGFQNIWETLNVKYGFQNFKTRYCNQDPLENFFGQIRSHAVRHTNPIPCQFEHSFITLLVNNMKYTSVTGGNCEIITDDSTFLSLEELLNDIQNNEIVTSNNDIQNEPPEMLTDKVVTEISITTFIPEYLQNIIAVILKDLKYCQQCNDSFNNSNFTVCARQIICLLNKFLNTTAHRRNILKVLLQYCNNCNVSIDWHECVEHHDVILKVMVRAIAVEVLAWWCTRKNILYNEDKNAVCEADINNIVRTKKKCEPYKKRNARKDKLKN